MPRSSRWPASGARAAFVGLSLGASAALAGCGTSTPNGGGGAAGSSDDAGTTPGTSTDAGTLPLLGDGGGTTCLPGLACNIACAAGTTTTVSGTVYDPAGKNPLYNVTVYVPSGPLVALAKGVPTGADACSCAALFKTSAIVLTTTAVDGSFTLTNVPVGVDVPLVIQIGKWRHKTSVSTTACTATAVPDRTLTMPSTVAVGNTDDNMPDIAVSTGGADTLECLLTRMGLPASEYVAGAGGTGHVHVFAGGQTGEVDPGGGAPPGVAETPGMAGAPPSPTALWANQGELMPYDIVLLSCEAGETFEANPPALEAYLNAGGRAFGSHYQYAWFGGPILSAQGYSAPTDWGPNLATWAGDYGSAGTTIGGVIETTVNGSTKPFAKGVALQEWLGDVGALGVGIAAPKEVPIAGADYNATVGPANAASQAWITSDATGKAGATMYLSFDTPVNAPAAPDGGAPSYCGRAVFSDLHVSGGAGNSDGRSPPQTCANGELSPQEKVLEFMLFDLSSCVVPDGVAPPDPVPR